MIDVNFFSSPIGLGHATRDSAMVNYFKNISTRFITGSSAARLLSDLGFDVEDRYNPPQFNVENGKLKSPTKWLWKYFQYYKDCKRIADKILKQQKPKLVVSDEDFASLAVAQRQNIPTVLVTDILETRFTRGFARMIERKMNKSMQDIIEKCNLVIMPEHGDDKDNIKRVGPIVRQAEKSRGDLRKEFGFTKKTVLVSIGGTSAGKFLIEKVLQTLPRISKDVDIAISSGPALQYQFKGAKNLGFISNLHEVIFAADVLVSLAGKSTMDEAKAHGTPGIFIPIKDHFEQEDNAKDAGFQFDDIHRLDELIEKKLEEKRRQVRTDGALRSYRIISELLR